MGVEADRGYRRKEAVEGAGSEVDEGVAEDEPRRHRRDPAQPVELVAGVQRQKRQQPVRPSPPAAVRVHRRSGSRVSKLGG